MSMPAPTATATITLADQKKRTLVFTHSAMKAMREEFGVSVMREGTQKLFSVIDEEKFSRLVAIGLNHKYDGGWPGVTEEELDEILTGENQLEVLKQIDAALGNSLLKNALSLIDLFVKMGVPTIAIPSWMEVFKAQLAAKKETSQTAAEASPPTNGSATVM